MRSALLVVLLVAAAALAACGDAEELSKEDTTTLNASRSDLDDALDTEETLRTSRSEAPALRTKVQRIVARGAFENSGKPDEFGLAALGELREIVPSLVLERGDEVVALDQAATKAFLAKAISDPPAALYPAAKSEVDAITEVVGRRRRRARTRRSATGRHRLPARGRARHRDVWPRLAAAADRRPRGARDARPRPRRGGHLERRALHALRRRAGRRAAGAAADAGRRDRHGADRRHLRRRRRRPAAGLGARRRAARGLLPGGRRRATTSTRASATARAGSRASPTRACAGRTGTPTTCGWPPRRRWSAAAPTRSTCCCCTTPTARATPSEAVWDGMAALRDDGLAGAIGVAPGPANGFTLDVIDCLERFGDRIDWAMVILNPLEPWPGEYVLPAADARGRARDHPRGGLRRAVLGRPGGRLRVPARATTAASGPRAGSSAGWSGSTRCARSPSATS